MFLLQLRATRQSSRTQWGIRPSPGTRGSKSVSGLAEFHSHRSQRCHNEAFALKMTLVCSNCDFTAAFCNSDGVCYDEAGLDLAAGLAVGLGVSGDPSARATTFSITLIRGLAMLMYFTFKSKASAVTLPFPEATVLRVQELASNMTAQQTNDGTYHNVKR